MLESSLSNRDITRRDLFRFVTRGAGVLAGSGLTLAWLSRLSPDLGNAMADEANEDLARAAPLARY